MLRNPAADGDVTLRFSQLPMAAFDVRAVWRLLGCPDDEVRSSASFLNIGTAEADWPGWALALEVLRASGVRPLSQLEAESVSAKIDQLVILERHVANLGLVWRPPPPEAAALRTCLPIFLLNSAVPKDLLARLPWECPVVSLVSKQLSRVVEMPREALQCLADARAPGSMALPSDQEVFLQVLDIVVNSIHNVTEIKDDSFLMPFLSRCLNIHRVMTEEHLQSKWVRWVCIVLEGVVGRLVGLGGDNPLVLEVERFCVEWPRVKEASNLYRVLKKNQGVAVARPVPVVADAGA